MRKERGRGKGKAVTINLCRQDHREVSAGLMALQLSKEREHGEHLTLFAAALRTNNEPVGEALDSLDPFFVVTAI